MLKNNFFQFLVSAGCCIGLLCNNQLSAQFSDDFSDGNLNQNPLWEGDTSSFAINENLQLQLNASDTLKETSLYTQSKAIENGSWKFEVQMDFNPSSSNYLEVYLVLDSLDKSVSSGYFLRMGSSSDDFSLYRKDGANETKIIDGKDKSLDLKTIRASVWITRDITGLWELKRDTTGLNNWISEGVVMDTTHLKSNYFLVNCYFTKTRVDKFGFDNFEVAGSKLSDQTPPKVISLTSAGKNTIHVVFSEELNPVAALNPLNFKANHGMGIPFNVAFNNQQFTELSLNFLNNLPNGQYTTLTIQNLEDTSGNQLIFFQDSILFFEPDTPVYKDIIINEIYADPHEDSDLPLAEFLELFNNSQKVFDLSQWYLSDKTKQSVLPHKIFYPGQYLVLCKTKDTASYAKLGATLGMDLPSLNNSGDHLKLSYKSTVIDELEYTSLWYNESSKENGGWSLELINPYFSCSYPYNWNASTAVNGGTPGKINSIHHLHMDSLVIMSGLTSHSPSKFSFLFSAPFDSSKVNDIKFSNNQNIGISMKVPDLENFNGFEIDLLMSSKPGDSIQFEISNYPTCYNSRSPDIVSNYLFTPHECSPGELIINELLFDPLPGGADFVEIYNNSSKTFDLQQWTFANFATDGIANKKIISDSTLFFKPYSYKVFTPNKAFILENYPYGESSNIYELKQLPNYNNDSSTVYLLNPAGLVIDRFSYDEGMHHPNLKNTEGVSLERINPNQPSNMAKNWHSAAKAMSYASPGKENSQTYHDAIVGQSVEISPALISPNGDGLDDFLVIQYKLTEPGCIGNMVVFSETGEKIKTLMDHELLTQEGVKEWDGTTDANQWAPPGIYVIYITLSNSKNVYLKEKKVVAVNR